MNPDAWLITFDFDGVLVDSLDEIVSAATKTFNELNGTDYESSFFRSRFGDMTGIFRTGRDIMPTMQLISEGRTGATREELLELKGKLGKDRITRLEKEYFRRKDRDRKSEESWFASLKPHEEAISSFMKSREMFDSWIVTTRDADSIAKFFRRRGYGMPSDRIIDKSVSHDKREQFSELKSRTGKEFGRMIFIEDTIYNAVAVKKIGVRVLLSTWGFSKRPQWKEAERDGITPIKQSDIKNRIEELTGIAL